MLSLLSKSEGLSENLRTHNILISDTTVCNNILQYGYKLRSSVVPEARLHLVISGYGGGL